MNVAIITGGSLGLGHAVAVDLVHHGWHVVIDGRDAGALHAAAERMGPGATAVPGDVSDSWHRLALVEAAAARGRLDLVVNNASTLGPTPMPPLRDLTPGALEDVMRVNVVAPLGLMQAALPLLAASKGAVVNVTSDAAVEPYEGWGGYGASKAALEQLSGIFAVEEPGVRVWWFDPGDLRTRMHQDAFPGEDISDRPLPESVAPALRLLVADRPPSGRVRASELLTEVRA